MVISRANKAPHEFVSDYGGDSLLLGRGWGRETLAGVELGIQRALFKHVLLDLGTRHAYSVDREFWEGQVYAGLNLMFAVSGRETDNEPRQATDQPEEVIVADSDNDGVPDADDNCPETPNVGQQDCDDDGESGRVEHNTGTDKLELRVGR